MAVTRIKNNQITDSTVVASAKLVSGSVTGGLLSNPLNYSGDFTISGNLTVNGTTTTVDTTNTLVADPVIVLSRGETGTPSNDAGILIERGTSNNAAWLWDETNDRWMAITTTSDGQTGGSITLTAYANIKANAIEVANITLGNIDISGNTISSNNLNGNINITPNGAGEVVASTLAVTDLTTDRIVYVGSGDSLTDNANLTFNGSTLVVTGTSNVTGQFNVDNIRIDGTVISTFGNNDNISLTPNGTGEVIASTLAVTDLTTDRVVFVGANDALIDNANLTFNGSTLVVTGTSNVAGQLNVDNISIDGNTISSTNANGDLYLTPAGTGNVMISTATADRIFFSGDNKELITNANLTFDGTTLVVTGTSNVAGQLNVDNIRIDGTSITTFGNNDNISLTPNGTGEVIASTLAVTDLTTDRIVYVGANDALVDNANLTFNGSLLVVTGTANVAGQLNVDNIRIDGTVISTFANNDNISLTPNGTGNIIASTATANRVFYAGDNKEILTNSNLTFDGSTLVVTGTSNVAGQLNVDNIRIDATTISTISNNDNISLTPNGSGTVVASTLAVTDLTQNRVVYVNNSDKLIDSANLTFDGTTLVVTGTANVSGQFNADNLRIDGNTLSSVNANGNITVTPDGTGNVIVNTATANRIFYAGDNKELLTTANLTFDGTNMVIAGDLGVNGGDITTTSTTATLFNANATTLNFGGAATTVNIGATTGTTIVRNDLQITGNDIKSSTGNVAITMNNTDVTIVGNLTVQGVTTNIGTNDLVVEDSLINLHTSPNLAPLIADDGRDVGLIFHYYKTSDKEAALVWANDSSALEYYVDATEGVGGTVSGTYGNIKAATFISNISTGTAPFSVNSTTEVANLNVQYANTVTGASQSNITSLGNLTIANIDNIQIDGNTISSTAGNIVLDPTANILIDSATANLVFYAGSNKELLTNSNLAFNGTTFSVTGTSNVTGQFNIDNIRIDGTVISTLANNDNISLTPNGTGNVIVSTATADRIFFSGDNKELITNANLTFDGTTLVVTGTSNVSGQFNADNLRLDSNTLSSTDTNGNVYVTPNGTGEVIASTLAVTDLTTDRVVFVGADDALVDSANLTFNGTTLVVTGTANVSGQFNVDNIRIDGTVISTLANNDNISLTPNGTGEVIASTLAVTDLTTDRVVFVGANDALVDNANLTFNGSTLVVTGTSNVAGQLNVDNIRIDGTSITTFGNNDNISLTPNGTGEVIASTLAVTDLSTSRVVYVGANDALVDSSNLTFDGTTHTVTGTSNVSGQFNIDNIRIDGTVISTFGNNDNISLTPNGTGNVIINTATADRVFFSGDNKELITNANLTFDGTTHTVTGTSNVTGQFNIDNIRIDDNTISSLNTNGNINLNPNGTGYVIVNSGVDSSDFIVNGNTSVSASYANIFYVKASTGQIGIGTNSPASNVLVDMDAFTTSVILPKGTTGQRPSGDELEGMLRYNISSHVYEFWDGTSWASTSGNFTTIAADSFSGDSTTLAFTLSQNATSAGLLVSINGVVQIPGTAYGVSGTTLTFTEAPQVGDFIDVRIITTTSTVTEITDLNSSISISDLSELASVAINGNVILQVSNAAVYPGTNGTINLGKATTGRWNTVYATNTSIQNADLAECYLGDSHIPPATVVSFGGNEEVTICMEDMDTRIAGVVSTHPAHVMNSLIEGDYVIELALQGRVPCRVIGPVRKGDMMVSAGNGMARAEENPKMGSVIGKALENFDGPEGIIEVVVGRV